MCHVTGPTKQSAKSVTQGGYAWSTALRLVPDHSVVTLYFDRDGTDVHQVARALVRHNVE